MTTAEPRAGPAMPEDRRPADHDGPVRDRPALMVVVVASAAVFVVEIAPGRLLAPYVGVSLETRVIPLNGSI